MADSKNNLLNIFLYIIVPVNLIFLGALGYWFWEEKIKKPELGPASIASSKPKTSPALLFSPSPQLMKEEFISPSPVVQEKSDTQLLKQAFAEKYNKDPQQAAVTIEERSLPYAKGSIGFEGEIGGGWWLGYKENGQWTIVADGNGTVPCDPVDNYGFPASMVPECWDDNTGQMVQR